MTHTLDALYKLSFRELAELALRLQADDAELNSAVTQLNGHVRTLEDKLDGLYKAEAQMCLNLYGVTHTTEFEPSVGGTRFTIRLDPLVGDVVLAYADGRFAVPGYVEELAARVARLLVESIAAQHRTGYAA